MSDRKVHADLGDSEVVRYDRAGKWYHEPKDGTGRRHPLTIEEAADLVTDLKQWKAGRSGGRQFDKLIVAKFSGGQDPLAE